MWGAWLDGVLYFSTASASRKGRNLRRNPSIAVHLESGDDALMFEGRAEMVSDRAVFARYAEVYEAKYGWRLEWGKPGEVTYAVRPRVAFTWTEKAFPTMATRWVFAGA